MNGATPDAIQTLIKQGAELPELMGHVHDGLCDMANGLLADRLSKDRTSMWTMLAIIGVILLFAIVLVTTVIRRIAGAVGSLSSLAGRIAEGHYDNAIDDRGGDELAGLAASMGRMQG